MRNWPRAASGGWESSSRSKAGRDSISLAEIQEEILWLSEAAHMPVVWATQVLETLAKTGIPSRAEVTDAAMGVRAECVMLNKGEHIVEAVQFLDRVLHRMQAHHLKKRSMLRGLAVAQVSRASAIT